MNASTKAPNKYAPNSVRRKFNRAIYKDKDACRSLHAHTGMWRFQSGMNNVQRRGQK